MLKQSTRYNVQSNNDTQYQGYPAGPSGLLELIVLGSNSRARVFRFDCVAFCLHLPFRGLFCLRLFAPDDMGSCHSHCLCTWQDALGHFTSVLRLIQGTCHAVVSRLNHLNLSPVGFHYVCPRWCLETIFARKAASCMLFKLLLDPKPLPIGDLRGWEHCVEGDASSTEY